MKDIFGKALVDFLLGTNDKDIITSTSISENEVNISKTMINIYKGRVWK